MIKVKYKTFPGVPGRSIDSEKPPKEVNLTVWASLLCTWCLCIIFCPGVHSGRYLLVGVLLITLVGSSSKRCSWRYVPGSSEFSSSVRGTLSEAHRDSDRSIFVWNLSPLFRYSCIFHYLHKLCCEGYVLIGVFIYLFIYLFVNMCVCLLFA